MSDRCPPNDWPNRAASRLIDVAPHRWHVQIVGSGPDILMLHGAGASSHSWAKLISAKKALNRYFVPDLPGHAYTKSPRGRSRLGDVANDMASLLRHAGVQPQTVIAHSAGAAVALEMVRRALIAPERLVLVNAALEDFRGAAGWIFPLVAKALALNPLTGLFLSSGQGSVSQVRSLIRSTGSDLSDAALAPYAHLVSRRSHVDGTLAMMSQWSLSELNRALPKIVTPTLFIHGDKDAAVDVGVARRAAEAMPQARLAVLKDVGHLAHEEQPARVAQEIDAFLKADALT